ncbi:uracil-DNA glycosylase [Planctomycetaceae bacterium]|nr:uracil-DNA glycosylase [bacterium]MDC0261830.1 uracil-DNA glycosylase [Planctomycetaceae bacterium]MDC0273795.1 uracil-DNA glycosylase [Planctomycetaceae bacterium]MDC0307927.1 uracil-DNA glycosylase [Planctomycetaceae bacterium]MDG2390186.1 uracil-DNA glycosylase [Planctomycetaceae bacterium]
MSDSLPPLTSRDLREWLTGWQMAGVTQLPEVELPEMELRTEQEPPAPQLAPMVLNTDSEVESEEPIISAPSDIPDDPSPDSPSTPETIMPPANQKAALSRLAKKVAECTRCQELASTRTQTVFGVGDPNAKIMFIGEAPGADEDAQGEPFVGRAGKLLTKIIEACDMQREEIYICNILRCRPPGNRNPSPEEASHCREYLDKQIKIVNPEYIVCWGSVAAKNLLDSETPIGKMRGEFYEYAGAKVLCTYHPSYLLRNPPAKKFVWEDMQLLFADMGITLKS